MRKFDAPLLFSIVLPFLMPFHLAHASKIPLGINSRHDVFVQQVWHGDTPLLCLANRTDKDQTLQVLQWQSRTVPAVPLLQWKMAAGSVRCHDASTLAGDSLLEFSLVGGERLGLMRAASGPPMDNADPGVFVSYQGPNGVCPTPGTWTEQPSLWLKGGQTAPLALTTTSTDRDVLIEFSVDSGLNLPHVQVRSATSQTLEIIQENQRLSIKGAPGMDASNIPRVQLELELPEVTQPTMMLLSGRTRILVDGWQCFLWGVLVEP